MSIDHPYDGDSQDGAGCSFFQVYTGLMKLKMDFTHYFLFSLQCSESFCFQFSSAKKRRRSGGKFI